jgi:hypothetical protein
VELEIDGELEKMDRTMRWDALDSYVFQVFVIGRLEGQQKLVDARVGQHDWIVVGVQSILNRRNRLAFAFWDKPAARPYLDVELVDAAVREQGVDVFDAQVQCAFQQAIVDQNMQQCSRV